ncbi:hypothetical protein LTR78_006054 [Recurvomyces mirabilis]|uniref:Protein kinase domain-containing protein n=1 Tax=Recurvomyces mirabilis TaxID=574656 RepID=A0AAE0WM41_9PEZI|nr:hypothetical protein LTR78_006054 [Recurvomyces mirabilis]KAK5155135.1 hypothetical protein LTS14_006090 [Recurvomyces mirabilis]
MARFRRFRDWELKIRNDRHKPRPQIAANDIRTQCANDRQTVATLIVISRLRHLHDRQDDLLSAYIDLLEQQHCWPGLEASIILTEQLLEHVQGQRDAIRTELLGHGADVASPALASSPRGKPQATPGKSALGRRVIRNRGMASEGESPPLVKCPRPSRQGPHASTQDSFKVRKTPPPPGAHESSGGRISGSSGSRKRKGSGEGQTSGMRPVLRPRPNTDVRNGNKDDELDPINDLPDYTDELNQDERKPSDGSRDGRSLKPRSESSESSAGDRPTEEQLIEQLAIVDDGPMHDWRPEAELGGNGPPSRRRGQTPEVPIPFLGRFDDESDEEFQDHMPVLESGNGFPPSRPGPPSVPPPGPPSGPPPALPLGPPQPVWTKSRKARQLQFGNPFPGSLDQWQWAESLGEGGQGHAGLWVQYDQAGNVIDRMAVKELWYDGPGDWIHKAIWKDIELGVRTCREDDVHKMLSGLESSGSIDLRQRHDTARRVAQTAQDEEGMDSAIIPEPFIWSLLETLAEAAHLMYKGTLTSNGPPFNEILHRDIKPANVFLADNLGSGWPGMRAVAKLGDFGCAIERQARDTINPRGMVDTGTPYYMAPKQFGECQNLLPTPLPSRVNVYGIGKTILSLMVLTDPPLHNYFGRLPILITNFERSYSQRLWDLIEQCVYGPLGIRLTVEELLEDVRRHIQQNDLRTAGDCNVLVRADAYALLAKPAPRRGDRD